MDSVELTHFFRHFRKQSLDAQIQLIPTLMDKLGWEEPAIATNLAEHAGVLFYLGVQQIDHLAVGVSPSLSNSSLLPLLSHAYNRDVNWLAIIDQNGIGVYNVLWPLDRDGKPIPIFEASWDELCEGHADLALLTPEVFYAGELRRRAEERLSEKRWGPTLVSYLLRHFLGWRSSLLESVSKEAQDLLDEDIKIHTFFTRLLFARYAEDLSWEPSGSLIQAAGDGPKGLTRLFTKYRDVYDSSLFEGFPGDMVPVTWSGSELQHLVGGLYYPTVLNHLRVDFATLDIDLLGAFYEAYLSAQPRMIGDNQRAQLDLGISSTALLNVRKLKGIYYTPRFLVTYVMRELIPTIDRILDSGRFPRVYDPACGSGSFLVAAYNTILDRLSSRQAIDDVTRLEVLTQCIHGTDLDSRAVEAARLNLSLAALRSPHVLPDLRSNISVDDSLKLPLDRPEEDKYDIIVGNPPYIGKDARMHLGQDYLDWLRTKYRSAVGRYDLAYVFVELSLHQLRVDGVIGLVVPSNLLKGHHQSPIRQVISDQQSLYKVVDFQDNDVFKGVSNYISLLFLKPGFQGDVEVIRVHELKQSDEARAFQLHGMAKFADYGVEHAIVQTRVAPPEGDGPWMLLTDAESSLQRLLRQHGTPLSEVAHIRQGAKTANNSVFIVTSRGHTKAGLALCEALDGFGPFLIETELLQPVVLSGDIRGFGGQGSTAFGLLPYKDGRLITEDELRRFPHTFEYLFSRRETLERRSTKLKSWYSWHHIPVGWDFPKIIGPDYAPRARFSLDLSGTLLPIGGVLMVPKEDFAEDLVTLLGLVNSSLFSWAVATSSVERKGAYYAFYGKFITEVPIVPQGKDFGRVRRAAEQLMGLHQQREYVDSSPIGPARAFARYLQAQRALDEAVFDLFAMSEKQRDVVTNSPFVAGW